MMIVSVMKNIKNRFFSEKETIPEMNLFISLLLSGD